MSLSRFKFKGNIVGCDEAGRGCLAGPVVAAAVILPKGYYNKQLNDSKKISEKIRNQLRVDIEKKATAIGIGIVDEKKIDQINILQASLLAMHIAIKNLNTVPSHLIIDGNKFNSYPEISHDCIVKGDNKFMNIAAASIIAKTKRDELMKKLSEEHPEFFWHQNKGYPTKKHREAIFKYGKSEYHRKSFRVSTI